MVNDSSEKLKRLIGDKEELLVIFAGDSHTWGQGAEGWSTALKPGFVTGEWRRLPESIPCFAQLVAGYLRARRTGGKETYVINSGYGCASTKAYLRDYWYHGVEVYRPDIVVLEFAINDWLEDRDVSPDEFGGNLDRMVGMACGMGAVPILLAPSPILGSQYSGAHYYPDYIERIRAVARARKDAAFADANRLMADFLSGGDRDAREKLLFDDIWHVAQKGQELYCRAIVRAMEGGE